MAELTDAQKKALARARARARKAEQETRSPAPEMTAGRLGGLAGRVGIEGATSAVLGLPALGMDAVNSMRNWPAAAANAGITGWNAVTGDDVAEVPYPTDPFYWSKSAAGIGDQLATMAGTPEPETPMERIGVAAGSGAVGSLGMGGIMRLLGSLPGALGQGMAAHGAKPIMDTVSGAVAGAAGQTAVEQGADPLQATLAGLAGGMAPGAVVGGGGGMVKGAVRGSEAGAMASNLRQARRAGTELSAGQAAEGGLAPRIEEPVYNLIGGRDVLQAQRAGQNADLGASVSDLTRMASGAAPDVIAGGRAVSTGVKDDFMPRVRATRDQLYSYADSLIPGNTRIRLDNFVATLDRLTQVTPGAKRTSERLNNPWLTGLRRDIEKDTGVALNQLRASPYELVKAMRTQIGRRLDDSSLITDVPRGELKALYAALMEDVRGSLASSPPALSALNRADAYNRAFHARVDNVLDPIVQRGTPEQVFSAVMDNTREGGTRLRTVMRSLPEEQRRVVAATIIDRLGRAVPSAQDETGNLFSISTFGSNWAKLSPVARAEVSAAIGPKAAEKLENIAATAARVKGAAASTPNPSGTGVNNSVLALLTTSGGLAGSLVGGNTGAAVGGAASLAAGLTAPRITARLMTSPTFVNWLSTTANTPATSAAAMVGALRFIAQKEEDPDVRRDMEQLLLSITGPAAGPRR